MRDEILAMIAGKLKSADERKLRIVYTFLCSLSA